MEILENNMLESISGGGNIFWKVAGIVGVFFAGFLDGFTNPIACRK